MYKQAIKWRPFINPTTPRRLFMKIFIDGDSGCWLWTGGVDGGGYGQISDNDRKRVGVHRLSYQIFIGQIPDGLQIDHLCRVRNCVNPKHLEPVTPRTNTHRSPVAHAARNARKTHCWRGHEFTVSNTYTGSRGERCCRECNKLKVKLWRSRKSGNKRIDLISVSPKK